MASRLRKRSTPKRRPLTVPSLVFKDEARHSSVSPIPRKSARLTGKIGAFSELVQSIKSGQRRRSSSPETYDGGLKVQVKKNTSRNVNQVIATPLDQPEISEVFGSTSTEIHPSVLPLLSSVDEDNLRTVCGKLGVKLLNKQDGFSLDGSWNNLTKVKENLSEILRSRNEPTEKSNPSTSQLSDWKNGAAQREPRNTNFSNEDGGGDASSSGHSDPGIGDFGATPRSETTNGSPQSGKEPGTSVIYTAEDVSEYSALTGYTLTVIKHPKQTSNDQPEDSAGDSIPGASNVIDASNVNDTDSVEMDNSEPPFNDKPKGKGLHKKKVKYKLCHCCGKHLMNLKRHNCQGHRKPKAGVEPTGDLIELPRESTSEYSVLINKENFKWYSCNACPMMCTRKPRIDAHVKASHTHGNDVPFNLIEREKIEVKDDIPSCEPAKPAEICVEIASETSGPNKTQGLDSTDGGPENSPENPSQINGTFGGKNSLSENPADADSCEKESVPSKNEVTINLRKKKKVPTATLR